MYAFTSPADCHAHIHATGLVYPTLLEGFAGTVLGRVQLSEDAFLAKNARPDLSVEWMASACRITQLHTEDGELAELLAARYRLPVVHASHIQSASVSE